MGSANETSRKTLQQDLLPFVAERLASPACFTDMCFYEDVMLKLFSLICQGDVYDGKKRHNHEIFITDCSPAEKRTIKERKKAGNEVTTISATQVEHSQIYILP